MRIISWNLLHTGGAGAEPVAALITAHRPDLLLMQEATARIDTLTARLGGDYARIPLPGRQHGLAAWSRLPFPHAARNVALPRGLIVQRVGQILDFEPFSIANVHLSHGQVLNRRQLRHIAAALPARAAILGDFNMVGAPFLRGFKDAGLRQPSHRTAGIVPLRLDRCLIRGMACVSAKILDRGASDHRPIMLDLEPTS